MWYVIFGMIYVYYSYDGVIFYVDIIMSCYYILCDVWYYI